MGRISVTYRDLYRVRAGLQRGVHNGLLEIGERVQTRAKANCPVESGALRASIGVEIGRYPSRAMTIIKVA